MNDLNPYQHLSSYRVEDSPPLAGYIGGSIYRCRGEDWHCTKESGAWGQILTGEKHVDPKSMEHSYPESMVYSHKNGTALSLLLRDSEEVAMWVHKVAVELQVDRVHHCPNRWKLISAAVLAIYPGYFTPNDNEARRSTVLNSFFDGLKVSSGECAGAMLVSLINRISWDGDINHLIHAMQYMPAPFVAMLVAHGLSIDWDHLWGERYEDALISGCVYQLTHPAEKYYKVHYRSGSPVQTPLFLKLAPKAKKAIFKLTGLTQKDVIAAKSLAIVMDPTKRHDYVSAFLHYLGGKSTLAGAISNEPALELPSLCSPQLY